MRPPSYIIACRNPRSKRLLIVSDDNGDPAEFGTEEEAFEAARATTCCRAWGAEIVPVDRPA